MDSPSPTNQRRVWPWGTVIIALAAILTFRFAQLADVFIYQRSLIFSGQVWRAWTGHIVHFGPIHFWWDLAVFLPAGCWLERLRPGGARWFFLLCPVIISLVLLTYDPTLERYAGLSGLATGTLVLLACVQLQNKKESPWIWLGVLLLVTAKLGLELKQGAPLLVSDLKNIRNVPLAHLSGTGCGLSCWLILWWTKRTE